MPKEDSISHSGILICRLRVSVPVFASFRIHRARRWKDPEIRSVALCQRPGFQESEAGSAGVVTQSAMIHQVVAQGCDY